MSGYAKLTGLTEICRGEVYDLSGAHYGIGRTNDMEIQVIDPTVSGMHCELLWNEDGFFEVVDEGYSTNGTRINGMIVSRQRLRSGDILQVGSIEFMYECTDDVCLNQLSKTDTHINLTDEAIDLNDTHNVAPSWWQPEHPRFRRAISTILATMLFLILALVGIICWRMASASNDDAPMPEVTTVQPSP